MRLISKIELESILIIMVICFHPIYVWIVSARQGDWVQTERQIVVLVPARRKKSQDFIHGILIICARIYPRFIAINNGGLMANFVRKPPKAVPGFAWPGKLDGERLSMGWWSGQWSYCFVQERRQARRRGRQSGQHRCIRCGSSSFATNT